MWSFLLTTAWAARLQLAVETDSVTVGETIAMQVQLIDGLAEGVPEVEATRGLAVRYRGQGQETRMVNFETTRITTYTYALSALTPGEWTLGPVELVVGGQKMTADPITIRVKERDAGEPLPVSVEAQISAARPFVGQVVHYDLHLSYRQEIFEPRWTPPDFTGLVQEPTSEPDRQESRGRNNGVEVGIQTVRLAMMPLQPGPIELQPAVLTADLPIPADPRSGRRSVDVFGRTRTRPQTFATAPVSLKVRPLPEPKPADWSGLVGHFTLTSSQPPTTVALGDTLTLEYQIQGDGSLSGFKLPSLPKEAGFRAYDDAPEVRTTWVDGQFVARATFKRALVPEQVGDLEIPPLRLTVFDPTIEDWVTLTADPQRIEVTPGEASSTLQTFGGAAPDARAPVENLGEDILPAPVRASLGDESLQGALPALVGLPLLLGLLGTAQELRVRLRRRPPDPWIPLRDALGKLPAGRPERVAELERIFREAAGLRLGRPAPSLDRGAVSTLGPEAARLYTALEAARYGGDTPGELESQVSSLVQAWSTTRVTPAAATEVRP